MIPPKEIGELEELLADHSQFLVQQPAIRSVFRKCLDVLKDQQRRLRDLERMHEETD